MPCPTYLPESEMLLEAQVLYTIVGGRVVYEHDR